MTLIQGDCVEVMRSMPEDSVDVIIADPPYQTTSLAWDKLVREWLPQAHRLLKKSGSMWLFASMRSILTVASELSMFSFAQDVVWEKHNGSNFHNDRFRRVHEHVLQFYCKDARWAEVYTNPLFTFDARAKVVRRKSRPPHMGEHGDSTYVSEDGGPRLMRSVLQVRSCHGYAVHPTQKPVELIKTLLEYSTPPGGVVLDPFAGSGSTLVAAIQEGFEAVGIEREPEYIEIAERRVAHARAEIESQPLALEV